MGFHHPRVPSSCPVTCGHTRAPTIECVNHTCPNSPTSVKFWIGTWQYMAYVALADELASSCGFLFLVQFVYWHSGKSPRKDLCHFRDQKSPQKSSPMWANTTWHHLTANTHLIKKTEIKNFLGRLPYWRLLPPCDAEGMVILAILALLLEELPEWSEGLGNERWGGWSYPKTNFPIRQVCPWLITFVPDRRC